MKNLEDSIFLAELMVETGRRMGKKMVALITDMDQPLGREVGNGCEIAECIDVLHGAGPDDLRELSYELSAWMFYLGGRSKSIESGRALAEEMVRSGAAAEKFRVIIELQGGDPKVIDDTGRLPRAKNVFVVTAPSDGFVARILCEQVGTACVVLGGGREKKEDSVDPSVGITVQKKVGDAVNAGEPVFTVRYNSDSRLAEARKLLESCFAVTPQATAEKRPLIHKVLQ
jgi:pyrimidine-nucleoside phosphorylase